jgi:hypothetical protein
MTKIEKRYFSTLGLSIAVLVAGGLIMAAVLGPPDSSSRETNKTVPVIVTIFFMAIWGSVAGFVAHEKGRGLFWIILSFIAPLQVVLLLLPYTKERRKQLESPTDDSGNNQSSSSFTEKDNLGTRHDSKDISLAYWMGERINSTRKDPFVMFTFKDREFAQAALLELPCIHVAKDSQKLICTERLIFGYYSIEDLYEAILCGDALTVELWEQTRASFSKYGGAMKSELAPTRHATITPKTAAAEPQKVFYVKEDHKTGIGGTAIYRIYKGADEQSAMAFLKDNPVTQNLLYLVVETPEGNFCRDKMGIYKED